MKAFKDFERVTENRLAEAQIARETIRIFDFFYDGSEIVGDIMPYSMLAIENGETFTHYTASEFCYAIECKLEKNSDNQALNVAYNTMCELIRFCN